jgi:hypothetical protein
LINDPVNTICQHARPKRGIRNGWGQSLECKSECLKICLNLIFWPVRIFKFQWNSFSSLILHNSTAKFGGLSKMVYFIIGYLHLQASQLHYLLYYNLLKCLRMFYCKARWGVQMRWSILPYMYLSHFHQN